MTVSSALRHLLPAPLTTAEKKRLRAWKRRYHRTIVLEALSTRYGIEDVTVARRLMFVKWRRASGRMS